MTDTAARKAVHTQGELIHVSRLGHTFMASRRTIAHLDWTIRRLKRRWPHATLVIIQTCYHTGVSASAGTHDGDCAFDFRIVGLPWWLGQRFLRNAGWGAWWRHTDDWAARGAWHFHAISLPPGLAGRDVTDQEALFAFGKVGQRVGEFIPGQVRDYFHRTFGLARQHDDSADKSWFPPNIAKTIYVYSEKDLAA